MAKVGYIRISSADQNVARQLDGVVLDRTFTDKVSGGTTDRPELQNMLAYVREGDEVYVHSIDRLARSLTDLLKLVETLNGRGVTVHFHHEKLVFSGADDKYQNLMLQMMGAVAEFERAMIKERQREGIVKAKEKGVYTGRKKTINDETIRTAMAQEGATFRNVAKKLCVGVSTVQRAMRP